MDESPWTTPASNRGRDLVASSATALATAQVIGAGGVIQGCYRTSEDDRKGELRVVSDPASCRMNELPISWNAQGPKGDKGDQGIQGIQGLQSPQGVRSGGSRGPARHLGLRSRLREPDPRLHERRRVETHGWPDFTAGGLNPYVSGPFVNADGSSGFAVTAYNGGLQSYYLNAYAICANVS
jgi:hypothetical protein